MIKITDWDKPGSASREDIQEWNRRQKKKGMFERIGEAKSRWDAGEPQRRARRYERMDREREELRRRRGLLAEKTAYERQKQQYRRTTMQPSSPYMMGSRRQTQPSIGGSLFGQSAFFGTPVRPSQPTNRKKRRKSNVQYIIVKR